MACAKRSFAGRLAQLQPRAKGKPMRFLTALTLVASLLFVPKVGRAASTCGSKPGVKSFCSWASGYVYRSRGNGRLLFMYEGVHSSQHAYMLSSDPKGKEPQHQLPDSLQNMIDNTTGDSVVNGSMLVCTFEDQTLKSGVLNICIASVQRLRMISRDRANASFRE
jgi:hypothetical protein